MGNSEATPLELQAGMAAFILQPGETVNARLTCLGAQTVTLQLVGAIGNRGELHADLAILATNDERRASGTVDGAGPSLFATATPGSQVRVRGAITYATIVLENTSNDLAACAVWIDA